jgi:hypothetical protein
MRQALILLAIAGYMLAQPAPHGYIGAGGCASSNCHGGTTALPAGESRILGNEYAHWSVSDKHARAYQALTEARGRRMADVLGIADAAHDKRCTVCHVAGSPEKTRSDGVACEACHGPAEHWLGPHTRQNSHEASVRAGMTDTRNLEIRAKTCLACHLGVPGQEVDHELIAAGHPDLAFELDTFTAAQPAHHRPASNAMRHRAWAVGQAVGLAESMRLLQSHAGKSGLEFSDLECYQCHHDLRSESWRIQRGYAGRKPGTLQVNTARIEMVRALLSVLSPEERTALDSAAARLNSAAPLAAKAIEHIADSLAARVQKQDIDPAAVLRAVAGNIQRIADGGVNAAEQATMTLDALGTNSEATAPLYDYLEHPSLYRPSEFVTLFQKAAAKQ